MTYNILKELPDYIKDDKNQLSVMYVKKGCSNEYRPDEDEWYFTYHAWYNPIWRKINLNDEIIIGKNWAIYFMCGSVLINDTKYTLLRYSEPRLDIKIIKQ